MQIHQGMAVLRGHHARQRGSAALPIAPMVIEDCDKSAGPLKPPEIRQVVFQSVQKSPHLTVFLKCRASKNLSKFHFWHEKRIIFSCGSGQNSQVIALLNI